MRTGEYEYPVIFQQQGIAADIIPLAVRRAELWRELYERLPPDTVRFNCDVAKLVDMDSYMLIQSADQLRQHNTQSPSSNDMKVKGNEETNQTTQTNETLSSPSSLPFDLENEKYMYGVGCDGYDSAVRKCLMPRNPILEGISDPARFLGYAVWTGILPFPHDMVQSLCRAETLCGSFYYEIPLT